MLNEDALGRKQKLRESIQDESLHSSLLSTSEPCVSFRDECRDDKAVGVATVTKKALEIRLDRNR